MALICCHLSFGCQLIHVIKWLIIVKICIYTYIHFKRSYYRLQTQNLQIKWSVLAMYSMQSLSMNRSIYFQAPNITSTACEFQVKTFCLFVGCYLSLWFNRRSSKYQRNWVLAPKIGPYFLVRSLSLTRCFVSVTFVRFMYQFENRIFDINLDPKCNGERKYLFRSNSSFWFLVEDHNAALLGKTEPNNNNDNNNNQNRWWLNLQNEVAMRSSPLF